jgi:hypothetical protein
MTGSTISKTEEPVDPQRRVLTLNRPLDHQLYFDPPAAFTPEGGKRSRKPAGAGGEVGLFISTFQPLDHRKVAIIRKMQRECRYVIVAIGSCNQKDGAPTLYEPLPNHPFSPELRMSMLKTVFGSGISILKLKDIQADTIPDWYHYVRTQIRHLGMPDPSVLYVSRPASRIWYGHWFNESNDDRRLVVCDTAVLGPPSAELREMMNLRLDDWKPYVPDGIHAMIEQHYPAKFRIPLLVNGELDNSLPEGTHVIRTDQMPAMRYQRLDGRWRPVREARRILRPTG